MHLEYEISAIQQKAWKAKRQVCVCNLTTIVRSLPHRKDCFRALHHYTYSYASENCININGLCQFPCLHQVIETQLLTWNDFFNTDQADLQVVTSSYKSPQKTISSQGNRSICQRMKSFHQHLMSVHQHLYVSLSMSKIIFEIDLKLFHKLPEEDNVTIDVRKIVCFSLKMFVSLSTTLSLTILITRWFIDG